MFPCPFSSLLVVEHMRNGISPEAACLHAIQRISKFYPSFSGALVAVSKNGTHGESWSFPFSSPSSAHECSICTLFTGAACHGFPSFRYSVRTAEYQDVQVKQVACS